MYLRLNKFDDARYPQGEYFNDILGKISHRHIALKDFSKLPESRQNHARFSFVRNPYDRFYSGFLQRQVRLSSGAPPPDMHPNEVKRELCSIKRGFPGFAAYCLDCFHRTGKPPGGHPLRHYVYHNNKPAVDYVGFVETFEASFEQICHRIGIEGANVGNANVRYETENLEAAKSFSQARFRYLDKYDHSAIEAVNSFYEGDFDGLGYRLLNHDDLDGRGQTAIPDLSPFSDTAMPERRGQILAFE